MALPADPPTSAPPAGAPGRPSRSMRVRRPLPPRRDPFGPVLEFGRREVRVGLTLGVAGALLMHGAAAATAVRSLPHMAAYARDTRGFVLESLFSEYDIDLDRPAPPPPKPEPEKQEPEQPEAEPVARREAKPAENEVAEKPPEAAQAANVLTAEPDPDAPLDFTDEGFVVGAGDRYSGGITASRGTSKTAVYDRRAKADGVPGGAGERVVRANPKPKEPEQDLSRPAMPIAGGAWEGCPWPAQADVDQVNFARVLIVVTVGPDGRAQSVAVQSDPGHGFGDAARRCAMGKKYTVGLDRFGKPTTRTTPPFNVRFER